MRFPNTSHELVKELERMFPEVAIGPDTTMDEIKFKAGQRSVIRYCQTWRDGADREPRAPARRGAGRIVHSQDA